MKPFLAVQYYLQEVSTLDEGLNTLRQAPYNLHIVESEDLILLKYHQYLSDMSLPICRECRGLILDRNTFDGEVYAPKDFRWDTCVAQEKIDGSIIRVYSKGDSNFEVGGGSKNYKIATNGTIDADRTPLPWLPNMTFGHMVRDIFDIAFAKPVALDPTYTYIFELVGPANRVVVRFASDALYVLGARSNIDGTEILYNDLPTLRTSPGIVRIPREYHITSPSEALATVEKCDPMKFSAYPAEGFVLVDTSSRCKDGSFRRLKIKSPAYLSLHRLKGEGPPTPKRVLSAITREKDGTDDLGALARIFPELKAYIDPVIEKYHATWKSLYSIAEDVLKAEAWRLPRKEYAETVATPSACTMFAFSLLKKIPFERDDIGNIVDTFLRELGEPALLRLVLGKGDEYDE